MEEYDGWLSVAKCWDSANKLRHRGRYSGDGSDLDVEYLAIAWYTVLRGGVWVGACGVEESVYLDRAAMRWL